MGHLRSPTDHEEAAMIDKILIATLAAATLFIATANAAVVSSGSHVAADASTAGEQRSERIRYDGLRAPGTSAPVALSALARTPS
jgi:hypothetical protein